ncbi:ArnT family glycosyltransferase [Actinophytocola xanthii]|uniref:Glycosyltransferase RgtA/B/C/D-like domain-containing protein n=1 Tax=Actinophytocola xanthii TaxID=1912961 RepID=A0A1Q8CR28_9PSEU|nr:glycosyltransferase family 39 protein [Actinophytocola xanthii]OLF16787.1 hypothetical protein BU204_15090 [Actinophytocola xanthii]
MVANGDPNPHFFNYPSLFLYLNALVHFDGPLLGWIPGLAESAPVTATTGVSFAQTPAAITVHRLLTVVFGLAVVVVGWATARRLTTAALPPVVTAALLALSPTLVAHSTLVTPDMLAVLFVGLGVLCAVWVHQSGSWWSYLVAGAMVGLAASAKYTAVLVAVPLVVAAALAGRRAALLRLPAAGGVALAAFLATTPFALLDREEFLADVEFERRHYATGHDGMEGDTLGFYADWLVGREGVVALAAVAGLVAVALLMREKWRIAAILLAFPVVYSASVSMQVVRNDRTIMLILPPLAVLAAFLVERVRWPAAVAAAVALAVTAPAALPQRGPTTWTSAREWLNQRPASTVLIESYSPYVDPERHEVLDRVRLIDGPVPPGTDYVVASEGMYGRYLTGDHPEEERAYRSLFARWPEVARFTGNGPTIVVLRVP